MRNVVLSKRTSKKLIKLLEYLESEWSLKVKNEFIEKLDDSINQIRIYPESFQESEIKKGLRKCVVTKQTTLYFRSNSKSIKVITMFDNRMNPGKLNKEL